jgi:hypothetical protein
LRRRWGGNDHQLAALDLDALELVQPNGDYAILIQRFGQVLRADHLHIVFWDWLASNQHFLRFEMEQAASQGQSEGAIAVKITSPENGEAQLVKGCAELDFDVVALNCGHMQVSFQRREVLVSGDQFIDFVLIEAQRSWFATGSHSIAKIIHAFAQGGSLGRACLNGRKRARSRIGEVREHLPCMANADHRPGDDQYKQHESGDATIKEAATAGIRWLAGFVRHNFQVGYSCREMNRI